MSKKISEEQFVKALCNSKCGIYLGGTRIEQCNGKVNKRDRVDSYLFDNVRRVIYSDVMDDCDYLAFDWLGIHVEDSCLCLKAHNRTELDWLEHADKGSIEYRYVMDDTSADEIYTQIVQFTRDNGKTLVTLEEYFCVHK